MKNGFTRYLWVYFIERKSDAANVSRNFWADVRAHCVPFRGRDSKDFLLGPNSLYFQRNTSAPTSAQNFLKASAASDFHSMWYTHAYQVKSSPLLHISLKTPNNGLVVLGPLRSTKNLPSFSVARDYAQLANSLMAPFRHQTPTAWPQLIL